MIGIKNDGCDVFGFLNMIWVWIFDMSLIWNFDVKIMTSIEWYCLWIWCCAKVLILLVFWMIFDWIFGGLLDEILWIECNFWLSSIEALFYKGLMGFLVLEWWFLVLWKVVKCLILLGFIEVGIELKMGVEAWKHQICPFWQPVICPKM